MAEGHTAHIGSSSEELTAELRDSLLDSTDTFLFDCDGVLWSGNDVIPGAQDVIRFLRSKGKAVCFVSNNDSKSREQYHQRMLKMGFDVRQEEIFCVSYVAAYYLRHVLDVKGKVYLVGMPGFGHELDLVGVAHTGSGADPTESELSSYLDIQLDPEVDTVLVGYDLHFSFPKIVKALSYLRDPSCRFIACAEDPVLPTRLLVVPGTGCFTSGLRKSSGREPVIVGKPHRPIYDIIQQSTKLDPARTLMIGDRLTSDVKFGRDHSMKTLLVFTGATQRTDLSSASAANYRPDFTSDSVADLLPSIP